MFFSMYTPQVADINAMYPQFIPTLIAAIVSSTVIGALVSGLIQLTINKRNSRIQERKNENDAQSDVINRYKEAAAEERQAKESAVNTIKAVLESAEQQIDSLRATINQLTDTIAVINQSAQAQQDLIDRLTIDRDKLQDTLYRTEERIATQKEELLRYQREVRELTERILGE